MFRSNFLGPMVLILRQRFFAANQSYLHTPSRSPPNLLSDILVHNVASELRQILWLPHRHVFCASTNILLPILSTTMSSTYQRKEYVIASRRVS